MKEWIELNKTLSIALLGILFLTCSGGNVKAESATAAEEISSLERKLEGSPLQIRGEGLSFAGGFLPELVAPVDDHYQSRFSNGLTAVYTVEPLLQEKMKKYFQDHHVPYGVFVAMDPYSGKILAMVEYSSYHPRTKGWAVKASYPSASVFKLVTAAAALEEKKASPDTMISFHGGLYRLRRNNWEDSPERDFRKISLTEALAKSANVPFAKVATRWLDNATLLNYANAFGFNQVIPFEIPVQVSHASIPENRKEVAYTAAGFGDTEMSPIHGALIASAIGNGGDLVVPHIVDKIIDQNGNEIYSPKKEIMGHVVSLNTTDLLKEMMGQTVISGTSRRAFRRYHRSAALRDITIGGKTGSLTGSDPPGKYSWFVGMAPLEKPEVAIAALVINNGRWRIKGSDVAKEGLTHFFKNRD